MSGLETVVRPFQQPTVFNTQKIVPSVPTSVSPARLKWGDAGTLPSPISALAAVNLSQETYTETARKTENVTITNPSDSSQFVIDARAVSVNFDKSSAANTLQSALVTGVDAQFNAFSSEIRAAFQPFDPEASSGVSKVTMNFKFPDS